MMNIAFPLVMLIAILILVAAVLFTQVAPALVTYRRRILSGEGPMIEHDDRRSDQIATTVDKLVAADVARVSQSERPDRAPAMIHEDLPEQLFALADAQELRSRWTAIQSSFVDEPRSAVEAADKLVDGAMKRLVERFADERKTLKAQVAGGEDVSTENLRLALRRSRQLLERLLSL